MKWCAVSVAATVLVLLLGQWLSSWLAAREMERSASVEAPEWSMLLVESLESEGAQLEVSHGAEQ